MKIINLYGGPGSGKSTMAAYIFSELKERGYNAELVTEYAKDLTWQKSMAVLDNQLYVFAKQHHRIWRLKDQVEFVVTDAPLLNSLIYGESTETFKRLVIEQFHSFESINIFLQRVKPYNPSGRSQSEDEAKEIDVKTLKMLEDCEAKIDLTVPGWATSRPEIIEYITKH
jgi:molybdopterin-guanine dinucleotide biosynthesis protein